MAVTDERKKLVAKRQKLVKMDGLGPYEIKRIRSAVRDVWQHCYARKLVIQRCTGKDGFLYCEICKDRTPTLKVDHIINVGKVDQGFITRMFVPSAQLEGMCPECHNVKTQVEKDTLGVSSQRKRYMDKD